MPTWLATLLLLCVTAAWGATFVVVRDAVAVYGVQGFLALRFLVAAAALLLLYWRRLSRPVLIAGLGIGSVLVVGYLLQTWGLRFTTATNSGLITGLFVVFAPIADRVLNGTRLRPLTWFAVLISLGGMCLLTGKLPTSLALGDLLTLGCALAFGVHIALLSRWSPRLDPAGLACAQMVSVAAIFLVLWPLTEPVVAPPPRVWFAIVLTGLVASALAYLIQTAVQRHLPTIRVSVILTTEPIFAGLFGFWLAGERLGPVQIVGAAVIMAALLLVEIVPRSGRASREG